jgi:hypothetical protein
VRLSQKSARTGSKYRNIVEIVVTPKIEFGYRHPNLIITPMRSVEDTRQRHPLEYTA